MPLEKQGNERSPKMDAQNEKKLSEPIKKDDPKPEIPKEPVHFVDDAKMESENAPTATPQPLREKAIQPGTPMKLSDDPGAAINAIRDRQLKDRDDRLRKEQAHEATPLPHVAPKAIKPSMWVTLEENPKYGHTCALPVYSGVILRTITEGGEALMYLPDFEVSGKILRKR